MKHETSSDERWVEERLWQLRQVPPRDTQAAQRGRAMFLAEVDRFRRGVSNVPERRHKEWFERIHEQVNYLRKERSSMITTLASIFVAVVLFFGGAGVTAYAAQEALPGDTLYGVKTATEEMRLAMTAGNTADAQLYCDFIQRRVNEMEALAAQGRFGDFASAAFRLETQVRQAARLLAMIAGEDPAQAGQVAARLRESLALQVQIMNRARSGQSEFEFLGITEVIGSDAWTISGQVVGVTPQTRIPQVIMIGDLVKVKARVADDGGLTAVVIDLIESQGKDDFRLTGTVETMAEGIWVVAGRNILITPQTKISDTIGLGDVVRIEGVLAIDGSMVARVIRLADGSNGNGNENRHGNENHNWDDGGNGNENLNGDDHGNGNGNENHNGDDNGNENRHGDENGNENHNGDDSGNENHNGEDNGNVSENHNGDDDENGGSGDHDHGGNTHDDGDNGGNDGSGGGGDGHDGGGGDGDGGGKGH